MNLGLADASEKTGLPYNLEVVQDRPYSSMIPVWGWFSGRISEYVKPCVFPPLVQFRRLVVLLSRLFEACIGHSRAIVRNV